jgi:hypothetical protein
VALAVCLLFDSRSDRLVRELWARLEEQGVGTLASHTHGHHLPHLSLAVLRSWELDDVRRVLAELPQVGPQRSTCRGSLVFPRGRVALAPSVGAALVAHQERIVTALAATGADLHRHYRAGEWIPHVSIATRASASQLPTAVQALTDVLPLAITAERLALVDSGTGRLWPLPDGP